jgi:hypothetical protein
MLALHFLAEQRIAEALARGEFDALPGAGRPLDLEDDRLVPEDLRLAHRILRNAGYAPPEVESLRQIAQLERAVAEQSGDEAAQARAVKKLALLRTRIESRYYEKAVRRLASQFTPSNGTTAM